MSILTSPMLTGCRCSPEHFSVSQLAQRRVSCLRSMGRLLIENRSALIVG